MRSASSFFGIACAESEPLASSYFVAWAEIVLKIGEYGGRYPTQSPTQKKPFTLNHGSIFTSTKQLARNEESLLSAVHFELQVQASGL